MAKRTSGYSTTETEEEYENSLEVRPSRAEKKRQADRLTQLGMRLTELKPGILASLDLDDELLDAVKGCRALKRGNAKVRQYRLIGKLLRTRDTDPVFATLERLNLAP